MVRKTFRIIVTFVLPIVAIILSGIAIYLDHIHFKESIELSEYAIEVEKQHYEELIVPHTQHEEIHNLLGRLDNELEDYRNLISPRYYPREEIDNLLNIMNNVKRLRDDADEAWRYKDYDKAEKLINDAYDSLDRIPLPSMPSPTPAPAPMLAPTPWMAIILSLIVIIAVVVGVLVWYFGFRTKQ